MSFYTEQESTYKTIGVIGCGAAGGFVSLLLSRNPYFKVTGFDLKEPFSTLLPTGGGRCNLTFDLPDIREFVKNYPRGEKFLLSVFSRFNSDDARKLFADLGIKTYVQSDGRVFPVSDSALKTVAVLRNHLKSDNFSFVKDEVVSFHKNDNSFEVKTKNNTYTFDIVIVAGGGKCSLIKQMQKLGIKIKKTAPSLCALDVKEKFLYKLPGMSFKNVRFSFKLQKQKFECRGDVMFTDKSITGPGVFKVSALSAYEKFDEQNPLIINLSLYDKSKEDIENEIFNNSKRNVKNIFSRYVPENYIVAFCDEHKIDYSKQAAQLKKNEKALLVDSVINLSLSVVARIKNSEIVTAGGIDLKETDAKSMESKRIPDLFFLGEMLDIDGFTGGFNLQNCWSGAYICSSFISDKYSL